MKQNLKVFEFFAGIGAQNQALRNINIDYEIVGISEWNINSIIAYNYINNDKNYLETLKKDIIIDKLKDFTFSSNGKTPTNLKYFSEKKLNLLYNSHILSENKGSIIDLKESDIPYSDLWTYSFPCQDLSSMGKQKGMINGQSSSLLNHILRLLNEKKENNKQLPNFLLMENVTSIKNKRNIKDFNNLKEKLKSFGYYNYDFELTGYKHGIPQTRKRTFMVSSLDKLNIDFSEKDLKNTNLCIKDFLDIDKSKYKIDKKKYRNLDVKYLEKYKINNLIYYKSDLYSFNTMKKIFDIKGYSPTLLAGSKYSYFDNEMIRNLTGKESLKLMGFSRNLEKLDNLFSCNELNKMAGNSIIVNKLEFIFKKLFT
jgi:DNA (cytosine-5)-methyltransferase 1